jgi:cytochrome c biogenesis protein CcdA
LRVYIAATFRIVYALAGFAIVVLNVLIERKVVDWDPIIAVIVASVVGFVAFVGNLHLLKVKYDSRERNAARTRMHKPAVTALNAITVARPVTLEELGPSACSTSGVNGPLGGELCRGMRNVSEGY